MITIGIFTIPTLYKLKTKTMDHFFSNFLPASYVKWIEQSGARVVPIKYNASQSEIKRILKQVNGVLFPGGAISRNMQPQLSKFISSFKTIYNYAKLENDKGNYFPLWATCLGFEFLCMMPFHNNTIKFNYNNHYLLQQLDSEQHQVYYKLLKDQPYLLDSISCSKSYLNNTIIYMNHKYVYYYNKETREIFENYLNILSLNQDRNGVDYVSMIKYKKYPFYGVQWHPEKPPFETLDSAIPHLKKTINFSRLWSEFFINECKKNKNHLLDKLLLIRNYTLYNPNNVFRYDKSSDRLIKNTSIFNQNYYF